MRVIPFLYPWMLCHELHDPEELWTIVEHLWVDSVARPRAVEVAEAKTYKERSAIVR